MFKSNYIIYGAFLSAISTVTSASTDESKPISVNGNLSLVSSYVSRGLTNSPENDETSFQAALNVSYGNFYLAYWGSTLGYSFRELQGGKSYSGDKFEHDFIGGYVFDYKDIKFDIWDAFYYYQGGVNTTSNEFGIRLTKPIYDKGTLVFGIATYLNDAIYMNKWDTYATLDYTHKINDKFNVAVSAAASYFNDNGRYEGKGFLDTKKHLTFRFASTQLNYTLSENTSLFGQYIFGGYDRSGNKQKNKPVFGITYSF